MYREVVGSSGCFRAPETKSDAPGRNRAHQAVVHLRRSVPEPDVRTLQVQDGRSRKGRAVFMARSAPNFHEPHKSGFHNVPLHPGSWTYFGMYWKGVYYVWTVLCFGWCESSYVYYTLSSAVAQYLRHLDVPITTWLDYFCRSNIRATQTQSPAQQREAARGKASLAITFFISPVISYRSPSRCSSPRHDWRSWALFARYRGTSFQGSGRQAA